MPRRNCAWLSFSCREKAYLATFRGPQVYWIAPRRRDNQLPCFTWASFIVTVVGSPKTYHLRKAGCVEPPRGAMAKRGCPWRSYCAHFQNRTWSQPLQYAGKQRNEEMGRPNICLG